MEYKVIYNHDERFPQCLREIADSPGKLYYMGNIELLSSYCVAVVGSRKCSDYGRRTAMKLGGKLAAEGITVVSGMARGVDTFAHKGALEAGGKTIAVMGTPIDECYPAANRQLKERIIEKGLVLSEYPPGYPTDRKNFPQRNRIISGLSRATILGEAGLNSGALITANLAVDQGREVYAIPANIDNPKALGGNLLIKDGASPLVVLDDIFDDLGIMRGTKKEYLLEVLEGDEKIIALALGEKGEMTVDELCIYSNLTPSNVNGIVTVMEMKGLVHTELGKIFLAK